MVLPFKTNLSDRILQATINYFLRFNKEGVKSDTWSWYYCSTATFYDLFHWVDSPLRRGSNSTNKLGSGVLQISGGWQIWYTGPNLGGGKQGGLRTPVSDVLAFKKGYISTKTSDFQSKSRVCLPYGQLFNADRALIPSSPAWVLSRINTV